MLSYRVYGRTGLKNYNQLNQPLIVLLFCNYRILNKYSPHKNLMKQKEEYEILKKFSVSNNIFVIYSFTFLKQTIIYKIMLKK